MKIFDSFNALLRKTHGFIFLKFHTNEKKTHFFLILLGVSYLIYYCCEGKMADVVEPDLKIYALLQPIRNVSDSDDLIVYSIDESYKYDSIDISILEDILNKRHVNYLITKNNEVTTQ